MFTDPVWCNLRGTARPADSREAMPPGMAQDFWHSPEFRRLDDATGNILTIAGKSASVYDLGIDWGQPFHSRQWSSGVIAIRRVFQKIGLKHAGITASCQAAARFPIRTCSWYVPIFAYISMYTVLTQAISRICCVLCRCADLPYVFRSNRDFCHLLVIIPGPKEPKSVDPYVDELLRDFKKYGPSGMLKRYPCEELVSSAAASDFTSASQSLH